jgi:hypothetical protein
VLASAWGTWVQHLVPAAKSRRCQTFASLPSYLQNTNTMLAWRGGRRRLVREQKARRRLEGVFNAAAKISKLCSKPISRHKAPATIEALGEQFSALRTKLPPEEEVDISAKVFRSNDDPAQASPWNFRALPAFPSLGLTGRTGISLDILAIQGGRNHLQIVSKTPPAEDQEEISNENNLNLHPPPLVKKKKPAPAPTRSKSKSPQSFSHKRVEEPQVYNQRNSIFENESNDLDPMSIEL